MTEQELNYNGSILDNLTASISYYAREAANHSAAEKRRQGEKQVKMLVLPPLYWSELLYGPSHSYKVAENLDMLLFSKDWTIKDELMLLDCIEKHGMGNWK
eukprot:gene42339-51711_t